MQEEEKEDPIVAVLHSDDLAKSEGELRAFLVKFKAKELRSACTKLHLGAQKRGSTHDNKAGYIDLLWKYCDDKFDGVRGALEVPTATSSTANGNRAARPCRFRLRNNVVSDDFVHRMGEAENIRDDRREQIMGLLPRPVQMITLTNLIDATSERSSHASSDERPPAKRRRHLTSEQDLERERKRKEASVERNYDEAIHLSKALQAAVATLNALKEGHATPEQVEGAEFVLNKLISRWKEVTEKATTLTLNLVIPKSTEKWSFNVQVLIKQPESAAYVYGLSILESADSTTVRGACELRI